MCHVFDDFLTFYQSDNIEVIYYLSFSFFMTGYLPVGFEYGVEITYPENEAISGSLLNVSAQVNKLSTNEYERNIIVQIFGLCTTQLQEYLIFKHEKILESNIMLCIVLIFGTIITALIRSSLRRQEAQHNLDILLENNHSFTIVSNTNPTVNT